MTDLLKKRINEIGMLEKRSVLKKKNYKSNENDKTEWEMKFYPEEVDAIGETVVFGGSEPRVFFSDVQCSLKTQPVDFL